MSEKAIDVLLSENRRFPPPEAFAEQAHIHDEGPHEAAQRDFEGFWAEEAAQLDWIEPWKKVLDWNPPDARWFDGGKLNACVNCVDRHARGAKRNQAALIWEGEPGDTRTLTYHDLYREVNQLAGVLKHLGVGKGDRVAIYLPMIPELVLSMLACARIGAIHSVIFAGFSAESLADRIDDAGAKLLITADGGFRRGRELLLKKIGDEALELSKTKSVKHVLVVKRGAATFPVDIVEGRDVWYHRQMAMAPRYVEPEAMEAEDILFTLYTSGSTGSPKGVAHSTGGYLTATMATSRWVFDLKDDDVYWCTADCGWITGHSYIVYGPLANGVTQVMYEGAPDWPDRHRFWEIVEKYGVTKFYTAPTAIRTFMRWGDRFPQKHDLSSLKLLGTVGEPINPEAWMWYHQVIGGGKCPIVDTWWQTETGAIMISPLPGLTTTKPGSATRPLPGICAEVVDAEGNKVEEGGGFLVIKQPWPSMLRTIWGDHDRYVKTYWSRFGKDVYFTGDGAKIDADGYLWVLGRVDDVINVAGHRVSTMEVESALVSHEKVAEAACVGVSDEVKGQAIVAFVTLMDTVPHADDKHGEALPEFLREHADYLAEDLREHVTTKIGAIAKPKKVLFSASLPKTRSGKIMRRLLRDIAEGRALGDVTTLADPAVIEELKSKYAEDES